ncbi:Serologically defined colon cancer antigen 8 like [Pseudolycoriella hygida]|uniref:Serologically defined colon cancer antigen 8 like n=1 Tax=Pseudolycoriella hygida TaxID=35572 RepID=A0A9Q0NAJ0_9DIPT|nr:Serologically defined colon cancer antigen 8 like [Pseudolycoriella hygida]
MLPKQVASPKKDAPLYKKRNLDFTDYAYREAVNRLKYLLADSYTATKRNSICHRQDDSDDTDNVSVKTVERPVISEISKYLPPSRYNSLKKYTSGYSAYTNQSPSSKPNLTSSLLQVPHPQATHLPTSSHSTLAENSRPPPEVLNFIEKQEGYIEQLERESQFCRDELNNLLSKVKDVITENETLTDQAKGGITRSVFPESSESDGVEPDFNYSSKPKAKIQLHGPNIVFESRISELEAQLAQASIDFKRLSEENEANKRKLAYGSNEIGGGGDVYKKQIENLQRDKQTLEETVRKLQHSIDDMKASDANNFTRTQRNRDLAEQNAFERVQADIEIKRLKDELERQHVRVREIQHEMTKRIAEERAIAERRYNYQVDQLGGDLTSQWEVASRLQLEVERHKRADSDYRRDLAQKNAQIEELKSELKAKTASLLSDVAQVNAEKQSLEQEITSLRLQLERADRQSKVETSRLNAEIVSLRQRLDRSDADLLHSRRENLRLGDQISSLEKDLALGDINREPRPSKEIQKLMADMEAKHVATVSDLEGMVQGQRQLMEKLTAECKTLTKRLEDTTHKHKLEKDNLRTTNNELMDRLKKIWTSYKEVLPSTSLHYSSDSDQINDKTQWAPAPIEQSPLRQDEPIYRRESPVELSRHSTPLENEAIRQSGRNSTVNDESSSKYVEPPETDGDKYTKDSIANEKQKSGSPVEYNYNKSDIEKETSLPSAQSFDPPTTTEPQYATNQREGAARSYEQPVQYNETTGYESNADNSANQQLYESNYASEEQPKYDEQTYEQYGQQPYDQTYNTYDQQQYDQQQYEQQPYDPQQYDTNQQYEQYPNTYDTSYTNQPTYQTDEQPPNVNETPLSGYTESTPSDGTVGQEYTGTRVEPKTQANRQQPQLLPKQSPQA